MGRATVQRCNTVNRRATKAQLPIEYSGSIYAVHNVLSFLPRDASAERGYEIACRLSVRLSVCL